MMKLLEGWVEASLVLKDIKKKKKIVESFDFHEKPPSMWSCPFGMSIDSSYRQVCGQVM